MVKRKYTQSHGLSKRARQQTNKIVKKALNRTMETKTYHHPRVSDLEFCLTSPVVTSFLNVPEGTADSQRVGDEILFNHLKINLDITGSVDGTIKSGLSVDRIRVLVFKWLQPDYLPSGANTPSAFSLFGANLPTSTNILTAMVNHEENGRAFKMLYDKKFYLTGNIGTHVNSPEKKQRHLSINVPLRKYGNKKVKYDSISPANNSHKNGLYMMVLTDNPGGVTQSCPTISYDSRLLFKDC